MIVFDMSGTIIKDNFLIYEALYKTIKLIKPNLYRKEVNEFYGCKKEDIISSFVDSQKINSPEIVKRNLNSEFNYFIKKEYIHNDIKIINNIPYLFDKLKSDNIKICVNTEYSKDIQNILIDKLNLNNNIDDAISSSDVTKSKPYPDMINELMKKNNIDNSNNVIKVGSTELDIIEGKNAKCKTVVVLSGIDSKGMLLIQKPDFIISNVLDLRIQNFK